MSSPLGTLPLSAARNFLPKLALKQPIWIGDLGGNSLDVLVAYPSGEIMGEKWPVISGESIGLTGDINPHAETILKQRITLLHHWLHKQQLDPAHGLIVATAGLRDASNGVEIAQMLSEIRIRHRQFRIEILSGLVESRLIWESLWLEPNNLPCAILEMGGGSTEVAWHHDTSLPPDEQIQILPLGTGRLNLDDPLNREARQQAEAMIDNALKTHVLPLLPPKTSLTIRMKSASEWQWLNAYLSKNASIFEAGLSFEQITTLLKDPSPWFIPAFNHDPKLAKKLISKLLIAQAILNHWKQPHLTFGPDWGLKFGALRTLYRQLETTDGGWTNVDFA